MVLILCEHDYSCMENVEYKICFNDIWVVHTI